MAEKCQERPLRCPDATHEDRAPAMGRAQQMTRSNKVSKLYLQLHVPAIVNAVTFSRSPIVEAIIVL